ncbi:MAG: hypothetical protein RR838_12895, partial [Clostridium sp.]
SKDELINKIDGIITSIPSEPVPPTPGGGGSGSVTPDNKTKVTFSVKSGGEQITGASITVKHNGNSVSDYSLLDAGDYTYSVTKSGYVTATGSFSVNGTGSYTVNVDLLKELKSAEDVKAAINGQGVEIGQDGQSIAISGNAKLSSSVATDVPITVEAGATLDVEGNVQLRDINNTGTLSIADGAQLIIPSGAKVSNKGTISTVAKNGRVSRNASIAPKLKLVSGSEMNMENGSKLEFNSKKEMLADKGSVLIYEGSSITIGGKEYIGAKETAIVNIVAASEALKTESVGSWGINGDGLIVLCINGVATVSKDPFDINMIVNSRGENLTGTVKIDSFDNMLEGSSIHVESGAKLIKGGKSYIGATGDNAEVTSDPVMTTHEGKQVYDHRSGVSIVRLDGKIANNFYGKVTTTKAFEDDETKGTIYLGDFKKDNYFGTDLMAYWHKSTGDVEISYNHTRANIDWNKSSWFKPIAIGEGDKNPYQLIQFDYNRISDFDKSEMVITNMADGKVLHRTDGPGKANPNAMYQWSYRDLSALEENSSNLVELERNNNTLLPAGTRVKVSITGYKGKVKHTISGEYTISDEDVKNATYVDISANLNGTAINTTVGSNIVQEVKKNIAISKDGKVEDKAIIMNLTYTSDNKDVIADGNGIDSMNCLTAGTSNINVKRMIVDMDGDVKTDNDRYTVGDIANAKFKVNVTENISTSTTFQFPKDIGSQGKVGEDYDSKTWGGLPYSTDGAFCTLELTNGEGIRLDFAEAFNKFSIQTKGRPSAMEYNGESLRNKADFGIKDVTHTGTKLFANENDRTKSIGIRETSECGLMFYGVHSDILGINAKAGDSAEYIIKGESKIDLTGYKINIKVYDKIRPSIKGKYTVAEFKELQPFVTQTVTLK